MKKLLLFSLLVCTLSAQAQYDRSTEVDRAAQLAQTITVEDLTRHLTILADDEMQGRETGQPGQKLAADYLADIFAAYGLPTIGADNSYFQPISFIAERWDNIEFSINGETQRHLWDYYALPSQNANRSLITSDEVIFVGYGIDDEAYSDYANAPDLNGKTILILSGEPMDRKGNSHVTGTPMLSDWSTMIEKKLRAAKAQGVATVLILDTEFKDNLGQARKIALDSRMHMGWSENPTENYSNGLYISSQTARRILGSNYKDVVKARKRIARKGKSRTVRIPADLQITQEKNVRELLGENVLGFVEGNDPELKDEIVIVTAHYDHIGFRGTDIYNGADDNGSGTSTVLEVCQAFVEAQRKGWGPRRSVLFMLVSGEEKGLLGSEYYVKNPIFPLEKTVANINVDMVGRVDEKHADDPNYIYVIGSDRLSTELHAINEQVNDQYTQLELDYTYNAEDDPNRYYYRSDHYNFAERGIPAVFYFNGTHEDYHRPSDTVDKINFEKMALIGQLVFHTAWELANRDERIQVDVPQK